MKMRALLILCNLALLCGSPWAAEKSAKLAPVRIAVVSGDTLDLPFWVACERGFFRDEGIDAEMILFKASLTVHGMPERVFDFSFARRAAEGLR